MVSIQGRWQKQIKSEGIQKKASVYFHPNKSSLVNKLYLQHNSSLQIYIQLYDNDTCIAFSYQFKMNEHSIYK